MCRTASSWHPRALVPHARGILSQLSAAQVNKWTSPLFSFCFWVFLCYHLLSISTHHLPQKVCALLRSHAFPTVTLLQKFQTSGRSPGRTCNTVSIGPCLDRESLHLILFLKGSASIQIGGFCFGAVQGGPLLLEQTPLTSPALHELAFLPRGLKSILFGILSSAFSYNMSILLLQPGQMEK